MGKPLELTGQRFGRLTVLSEAERNGRGIRKWLCRCDCGNEKSVRGCDLTTGHTQSCGCLQKEVVTDVLKQRFELHGKSRTRVYKIWAGMKQRCTNPNADAFENYGGRGIKVCNEWLNDFQSFYEWAMSNGYSDKLTIDRKNNDGDYCPENCRWATYTEQNKNRRKQKKKCKQT